MASRSTIVQMDVQSPKHQRGDGFSGKAPLRAEVWGSGSVFATIPWAILGALALYSLWAGVLILQNPGFQYDEALLVLGAVHMRTAPGELTLPHDPNTWFCPSRRCFPIMTVRYVGAIKEYLCLPLFAALGPSAEVVRIF